MPKDGTSAPLERYNARLPNLQHYYGLNHLHYLTNSTYRRARLYDSERFRNQWVATLGDLRRELGFKIVGYVLMPEHFHALIWPTAQADPSQIVQKLEDRTALLILKNLKENLSYPWCQKMLARVTLPPTVHHHAHFRIWQRKGYDMNMWTPKKRDEKLHYMHNNPVKRGLVKEPGDWPWSSWRFYFLNDTSLLAMDAVL
jgi:putative transposase